MFYKELLSSLLVSVLGLILIWGLTKLMMSSLLLNEKIKVENYSGRKVALGLGVVWLAWALVNMLYVILPAGLKWSYYAIPVESSIWLVLFAVMVGFVDDFFGDKSSQGFKGHIKELFKGRLSTGAMKLFLISGASFIFAWIRYLDMGYGYPFFTHLGLSLLAGAAIALTCNFINLTDLRPGRASKAYMILLVPVLIALCYYTASTSGEYGLNQVIFTGLEVLANVLWLLAPVIATIGYDLKEKAMLGDAGASGLGVLVGIAMIAAIDHIIWLLALYTVLMFVLNLASEKISFSKVIETNTLLKKVDMLGRLKSNVLMDESSSNHKVHDAHLDEQI